LFTICTASIYLTCWMLCTLSFICSHLLKGTEQTTYSALEWVAGCWQPYCRWEWSQRFSVITRQAGRRPAGGRSQPVKCYRAEYNRSLRLSQVCIIGVKYNSTFTHRIVYSMWAVLFVRWCSPLWEHRYQEKVRIAVSIQFLWSCFSACVCVCVGSTLWAGHWHFSLWLLCRP